MLSDKASSQFLSLCVVAGCADLSYEQTAAMQNPAGFRAEGGPLESILKVI